MRLRWLWIDHIQQWKMKNERNMKSVSRKKTTLFRRDFRPLNIRSARTALYLNVHQFCKPKSSCFYFQCNTLIKTFQEKRNLDFGLQNWWTFKEMADHAGRRVCSKFEKPFEIRWFSPPVKCTILYFLHISLIVCASRNGRLRRPTLVNGHVMGVISKGVVIMLR